MSHPFEERPIMTASTRPESVAPESMSGTVARANYSPAVKVGNTVFVSGQIGRDAHANLVTSSSEAQIVAAWENVGQVLAAAGASFDDIVDLTSLHVDLPSQAAIFQEVKNRYIRSDVPPAWTSVGVAALGDPEAIVEIKVVAVLAD